MGLLDYLKVTGGLLGDAYDGAVNRTSGLLDEAANYKQSLGQMFEPKWQAQMRKPENMARFDSQAQGMGMDMALTFAGPMAKTANLAKMKVAGLLGKVDDEIQKTYLDSLAKDQYAVYGMRVIPHGHEVKAGDSLEHSKAWVDGKMTNDVLSGVSTIGIEKGDVLKALERLKKGGYSGKQIAIVKGDSGGYGEDAYERLIKNPEVVGAFLRE